MNIPSYLNSRKFSGIYCIENSYNKNRYVGSSTFIYGRLHKHKYELNGGIHQNHHLQNAWNKYSDSVFECYSIEFCEPDNLIEIEQKWIDILNPEYNITYNVERNVLSEESRRKISNTLKEKYSLREIFPTRIRKIKVYDLDGNYVKSFDSIKEASKELNIHQSSIIRVLKNTYSQAKKYQFRYEEDTSEVKKIELSKYARRSTEKRNNISIDSFDKTGQFLRNFDSISAAAKEYKVTPASIRNVLTGRCKFCRGVIFRKSAPLKKQGELLGTPKKDNQQPSIDSNIFEGSTTNSRILLHNVEDSNANTRALLTIYSDEDIV